MYIQSMYISCKCKFPTGAEHIVKLYYILIPHWHNTHFYDISPTQYFFKWLQIVSHSNLSVEGIVKKHKGFFSFQKSHNSTFSPPMTHLILQNNANMIYDSTGSQSGIKSTCTSFIFNGVVSIYIWVVWY